MSLLLEALKKAELAKQGANRPASAPEPLPPLPEVDRAFSLEVEPPRPEVMTREKLPDITQPLEILSEDLPSARKPVPESPAVQPSPPAAEPAPPPAMVPPPPEPVARTPVETPAEIPEPTAGAERDAARQLFDVKEVEYNPKRPFYITVGVLVAIAAGYAGYVWWQMQPKYSYSTTGKAAPAAPSAAAPPAGQQPAVPAPPPAPATAGGAPGTPVAAPQTAPVVPGAPAAPTAAAPAQRSAPAEPAQPVAPAGPVIRRSGERAPGAPAASTAQRAGSPAQRSAASAPGAVAITPPALTVDPQLERAWEAFQGGDLAAAREAWQQTLAREPNSRDALLGLAAIDVRTRSFDTAEARYQRLLELDPRDTVATAALIGLRAQIDPVQSESRLKSLIANQPEATHLYFTLGNQYAAQSRWSEAQQAYFKAWSAEPDNPDYAFNLAVSLDQLHQVRHAIDYYQRALALADKRPVGFDRAQAAARLQALSKR